MNFVHRKNHGMRITAQSNMFQAFSCHTRRGWIGKCVRTDDNTADIDSHSWRITNPSSLGCSQLHYTVRYDGIRDVPFK